MNYKLTLSVKLTAIFTLLIFVSVFMFSFLMIAFTKQSLERKQTEELSHFLNIVELGYEHSVREGIAFPPTPFPTIFCTAFPRWTAPWCGQMMP